MIELELTSKVKEWLDTAPDKRDIPAGALLLKRINRNQILYNNIIRNPAAKAPLLEYHLRRILKNRLVDTTHEEVRGMMTKVNAISKQHGLERTERSAFQNGKRPDHDELPDEVKQLYVENADILRRMREAHTRLRMISPQNSTCPDSDRYPFAKAIIEYDRKYRDNWNAYDHYVKGTPLSDTVKAVDPRTAQKNAAKTLNLMLGKYMKTPTEATAARIRELYSSMENPSDSVKAKMQTAGLL